MRYREAARIAGRGTAPDRFSESLRGLALDSADRLYAAGDSQIKRFDAEGGFLDGWKTSGPAYSVAVAADGEIWAGLYGGVERFDPDGTRSGGWSAPDRVGLITELAVHGEDLFVADASARWVHRLDLDGRLRNEIGDRHRKGGFHIPNGAVDFDVDAGGIIHVANPGMHRVERYRSDGEPLGHFGRFDGRDPAGFPGCCNPTNVALAPGGRIVVTEKAGPRVKLYDSRGELLAVIADSGFDPAAKNMDVVVDSRGRIWVADTVSLQIHLFLADDAAAEASRP